MVPTPLGVMGLRYVEKVGIPHTAAFHCQPENITFFHMGNNKRVNDWVYNRFRDVFYNRFTHIHCPSNMIASQLRSHGYTARLHVISSGIDCSRYYYQKRAKEDWLAGKFAVIMVGCYSGEKRQDVPIDAVMKSRHANRIQLILAGKGPTAGKLYTLKACCLWLKGRYPTGVCIDIVVFQAMPFATAWPLLLPVSAEETDV